MRIFGHKIYAFSEIINWHLFFQDPICIRRKPIKILPITVATVRNRRTKNWSRILIIRIFKDFLGHKRSPWTPCLISQLFLVGAFNLEKMSHCYSDFFLFLTLAQWVVQAVQWVSIKIQNVQVRYSLVWGRELQVANAEKKTFYFFVLPPFYIPIIFSSKRLY